VSRPSAGEQESQPSERGGAAAADEKQCRGRQRPHPPVDTRAAVGLSNSKLLPPTPKLREGRLDLCRGWVKAATQREGSQGPRRSGSGAAGCRGGRRGLALDKDQRQRGTTAPTTTSARQTLQRIQRDDDARCGGDRAEADPARDAVEASEEARPDRPPQRDGEEWAPSTLVERASCR
jgi:hypothetical protein